VKIFYLLLTINALAGAKDIATYKNPHQIIRQAVECAERAYDTPTEYYKLHRGNKCDGDECDFIAIRGTIFKINGQINKDDISCNSKCTAFEYTVHREDVRIHQGFYDRARAVLDDLKKNNTTLKKSVVITGHSLGGAAANILALFLLKRGFNVSIITFGAPPVFYAGTEKNMNNLFHGRSHMRFFQEGDDITNLNQLHEYANSHKDISADVLKTVASGMNMNIALAHAGKPVRMEGIQHGMKFYIELMSDDFIQSCMHEQYDQIQLSIQKEKKAKEVLDHQNTVCRELGKPNSTGLSLEDARKKAIESQLEYSVAKLNRLALEGKKGTSEYIFEYDIAAGLKKYFEEKAKQRK